MDNTTSNLVSNQTLSQVVYATVLIALLWVLNEPLIPAITISVFIILLIRFTFLQLSPSSLKLLSSNWLKNISSVVLTVIIVNWGWQVGLLNAMVNLLVAGAGLWWFTLPHAESVSSPTKKQQLKRLQQQTNQRLTLCLLFLIAVAFIYQQSLTMSLLYFLLVFLNFYALFLVQNSEFPAAKGIRQLGIQFVTIIPVTAILFVTIPNLPPFWKLPEQKSNSTGLSDSMTPGDIANLAESNRLAFRASFVDGETPEQAELYWRVLTMELFNGRTWQVHPRRKEPSELLKLSATPAATSIKYEIIAEPTQQPWLYALSNSVSSEGLVYNGRDNKLVYGREVKQRFKYQATVLAPEYTDLLPQTRISSRELELNKRLPKGAHIRSKQLADTLWTGVIKPGQNLQEMSTAYSNAILNYFYEQKFEYSLTPDTLAGDHIDDFLFNKKVGFCAHFASAYSVLMRMQGFATRIVTGYQGGEFNPNGEYFNVYDSSAHAWSEYWLPAGQNRFDNKGRWVRVDPTAIVAPNRLEFGLSGVLGNDPDFTSQPLEVVKSIAWLNELRQQLQSLDYYWTVWVLDFDKDKQQNLFKQLFQQKINWSVVALSVSLLIIIPGLALLVYEQWKKSQNSSWPQKQLSKIENKILKQTTDQQHVTWKGKNLTLMEYKEQLIQVMPEKQNQLEKLFQLLEFVAYNKDTPALRRQIKQEIKLL